MTDPDSRRLRARAWAERILENSQLRDNLEDNEAKHLISWAITELEQAAAHTLDLPDEEAETKMDALTDNLTRVMRQVNGLVPALPIIIEDELAEDLLIDFSGSVREITGREFPDDWIDNLIAARYRMNANELFNYLFSAMHRDADGG